MKKILFLSFLLLFLVVFSSRAGAEEPVIPPITPPESTEVNTPDSVENPAGEEKSGEPSTEPNTEVVKEPAPENVEAIKDPVPEDTVEPKIPETNEEVQETAGFLVQALKNHAWPVAVGFLLMLLVWAFNKFLKGKLTGNKWTPWIAVGVGVLGTIGINLAIGAVFWWESLLQGFLVGTSATGFWELLFKHFLGQKKE